MRIYWRLSGLNKNRDFVKHHLKNARIPQAIKNSVYKKYYNSTSSRTDIHSKINKAIELSEPLLQACYMPTTREELLDIYSKRQSKEIEQRSEWGDTGCAAVVNYLKLKGLKDIFPMRAAENEAILNDGFIYTDGPTVKRLVSDRWLLRQMRKKSFREVEQIALNYGLVSGHGQRYISNAVLNAVETRKQKNNELLKAITAINEEGQEYTLAELSELSVSNPAVRNTELMVRMRGNDEYAIKNNHPADMWTLTAPSKYHPSSSKWSGVSPRETQKYLSNVWAKFRASAKRAGFNIYGFRVAEPHKDACPHWHILIFFENEQAREFCREKMNDYALAEDGTEAGAENHRFDVEAIDRARGSAVGYIAKYITKNIDGANINDIDGRDPLHAAKRVNAWASVWGIRQFQAFGNPSVTTWRELRRLEGEESGALEKCREAADSGDWCAYFEAQGGHTVLYKDQPVKPAYWHKLDSRIEDVKNNEYGEPVAACVFGLVCEGVYTLTRFHSWTITDQPEKLRGDDVVTPWTCVNNCTEQKYNEHEKKAFTGEINDSQTGNSTNFDKGGGR